ncbi:transposase [Leisingera sp. MMG026]|uniref:transposase n=1 Tax=Leisingera sp. MMG026 TaxID=2909982 RepID=UPI0031BA6C37
MLSTGLQDLLPGYWRDARPEVCGLLFRASAEPVMTLAAAPKRPGAHAGMTSGLHTWGSALTHYSRIRMISPGRGLPPGSTRQVACKPGFRLHLRVLSRLFRRLFLEGLMELHRTGQLAFFGDYMVLADAKVFATWLRKTKWAAHAKPPFAHPVRAAAARCASSLPSGAVKTDAARTTEGAGRTHQTIAPAQAPPPAICALPID